MARLSSALCTVLAASALLLLLAAGPASAYFSDPKSCTRTVKKCLRQACKCGWSLSKMESCLPDSWSQESDDDYKESLKDPKDLKGISLLPSSGLYIDYYAMCKITELIRGAAVRAADKSIDYTKYFNYPQCQYGLGALCGLESYVQAGSSSVLFSRATRMRGYKRSSCGSCLSLAKTIAKAVCDPEYCPCPYGEGPAPQAKLVLSGTLSKGSIDNGYLSCNCYTPPNPCEQPPVWVAASTDAAAGK